MKLLLDACMSPGAVKQLRDAGHDVSWMCDWGRDPGDEAILARAAAEGRVLVTLDNDFGELAVARRQTHAGIVRLVEDSVWKHAELCEQVLARHAPELARGGVAVVERRRIRVHMPKRA